MRCIIILMVFFGFNEIQSQCLEAPSVHFGGSKVEWSIGTIDTFVKSPCYKYIVPKEMLFHLADPIEINDKVIYPLINTKYGTVLQGINHLNGKLEWAKFYNQTTEDGYGHNYYLDIVKKSDLSFNIYGTRYPIKTNLPINTSYGGHLIKREVFTNSGETVKLNVLDTITITHLDSRKYHKNGEHNIFYQCNYLGDNHPSGNNFYCADYDANFDQNIIQRLHTDSLFFNTRDSDGYPNFLRTDGPFTYGDSLFVYLSQYIQDGVRKQFLWSVDNEGNLTQLKDISTSIHGINKNTYFIKTKKSGDDILLTTVTPDDSYEGNYGYVVLNKNGIVTKSNNGIVIDGKKAGFIAVTKHTRTNEFIFAIRPQGQNDIYFYRETIDGAYIESAHLINPNRSVYALQPYNLLQTNDDGIVLTGSFVLDTFKLGNISPFQVGGWPVIMKLSAETLGLPSATSDPWQQPVTFSIAPNPSTNQITITTSEALSNSRIEIYDQIGRSVTSRRILSTATEIDISSLPTGLYFVSLVDDLGKRFGQVQKLVKIE